MSPIELFKLLGTISIDNGKANREIDQTTGNAEKSESRISAAFKKIGSAVVAGFAIDKIKDFGVSCIEAAAQVKATESQFTQVFGNLQGRARESLNSIADDTGIIASRMTGSYTRIAAFAKTTGMDTADAMELSNRAMIAVADSAAYYDRSLEETTESLQSFLKGNYENDAALGLSATETTRNAAANKLYGKSFIDLSEAQKQLTLLQMVEDANKLSGAMGQAARESDGWENVMGNLRESIKKVMVVIGDPILKKVTPVIQNVTNKFEDMCETVKYAQKWFKEHADTLATLAKVVGVATTAFVAFKTAISMSSLIQNARLQLALFTATADSAAMSQALLNGTFSAGEIIVGLLTGKITLAEIATALWAKTQAFLNATILANPVALFTAAIVAATAAIVIFKDDNKASTEELTRLNGEIEKSNEKVNKYKESMSNLAKERNKSIEQGVGEMNYYKSLSTELDGIVDKNGKVKKGYEDRAGFIVSTLNDALGVEMELNNGVIEGYDGIKKSIDELIKKKKAQIILDSYEAEYQEALKSRGTLLEDLSLKQQKANEIQQEMNNHLADGGLVSDRAYTIMKDNLEDAIEEVDKASNAYMDNLDKTTNYETMATEITKGNYDKVVNATGKLSKAQTDLTKLTKKELQAQKTDIEAKLDAINRQYKKSGDSRLLTEKKTLEGQLSEVKKNLDRVSSTVKNDKKVSGAYKKSGSDAKSGFNSGVSGIIKNAAEVGAKAASKFKSNADGKGIGKSFSEGVSSGIWEKMQSALDAAASLGSNVLAAAQKALDINSPSKKAKKIVGFGFVEGVVDGIVAKAYSAAKAAESVGYAVLDSAERALGKMNLSKGVAVDFFTTTSGGLQVSKVNGISEMAIGYASAQPILTTYKSLTAADPRIDTLIMLLQKFLPELIEKAGHDIYLDKDTLVGSLDESLESRRLMKERGI